MGQPKEAGWASTENLVKMSRLMKPHIDQEDKTFCYSHSEVSGENRACLPSFSGKELEEEENKEFGAFIVVRG